MPLAFFIMQDGRIERCENVRDTEPYIAEMAEMAEMDGMDGMAEIDDSSMSFGADKCLLMQEVLRRREKIIYTYIN